MADHKRRHTRRVGTVVGALAALLLIGAPSALAADGGLNPSFNGTGFDTVDINSGNDTGRDVAERDGKIAVAGTDGAGADFAVAVYNANGEPDTSFSSDGKTHVNLGGSDFGQAVAIQPDGKIVVAGYSDAGGNNNFAVARFTTTGDLDPTFNAGDTPGYTVIGLGLDTNDRAFAVALDTSNRIIVAGQGGSLNDIAIMRLTAAGDLDSTFNSGDPNQGRNVIDFAGHAVANDIAFQADGGIIVGGTTDAGNDMALARFRTTGTWDTHWGNAGQIQIDFGTASEGNAILVQPDDKIVIAGANSLEGLADFAMARVVADGFTLDGSGLDTSFNATATPTSSNGNGRLTISFSGDDIANDMQFQSQGRFLLVGQSSNSDNPDDIALAQVTRDGHLDSTFNDVAVPSPSIGDGKAKLDLGHDEEIYGLAVEPDGNLIVAGDSNTGSTPRDFLIARLNGSAAPAASVNDVSASESAGSANFSVTLNKTSDQEVRVDFATANGTATAGSDYTAQSGTLIFGPGETSKTVAVPITNDSADEPDETFVLNLTGARSGSVADGQGTGTITDDDNPTQGADITAPNTTALGFSAKVFRGAASGPSALARVAAKHKVGTRVSFTLTEAATVTFTVERKSAGRKVGKLCVKPTKKNRTRKRCTRFVKVKGSFTRAGKAGKNSFKFRGRMGGTKLKPGSYRLVAVAKDAAGNKDKTPKRANFQIARR
ncbi:MAG: hypothetical protein QOE08_2489 [Thermoleophilaceae bacterium]|nr:hypothetical protein [Thermoleophilaceae bacterium]